MLEPIFEPTFIADSYACRKEKGTHAAVDRCQQFARRFRYVFKADIRKFFPSMDHEILKTQVARKIKDPDVLWLVGRTIDGSNPQEEVQHYFPGDDLFTPGERTRGIPIGNQTSQFFANVYLDPLDHFINPHFPFDSLRFGMRFAPSPSKQGYSAKLCQADRGTQWVTRKTTNCGLVLTVA